MITNKYITKIIVVIVTTALLFCLGGMIYADRLVEATGGKAVFMEYKSKLFDRDQIISVDIQIDEDDWEALLDHAIEENYYECNVNINGTAFSNVGVRPKGNTSLTSIANDPDIDRYSLKLEFDRYVEGQTCFGLDKLVLNNNYADPTNMKEASVYEMYQYLNADASLYNYATVSVHGEYWGVYLALEAVEDSFLLRNYGVETGELYKPEGMDGHGGEHFDRQENPNGQEGTMPENIPGRGEDAALEEIPKMASVTPESAESAESNIIDKSLEGTAERSDYPNGNNGERPEIPGGENGEVPNFPGERNGETPNFPDEGNGEKQDFTVNENGERANFSDGGDGIRPDFPDGENGARPNVPTGDSGEKPNIRGEVTGEESNIPAGDNGEKQDSSVVEKGTRPDIPVVENGEIPNFPGENNGGRPDSPGRNNGRGPGSMGGSGANLNYTDDELDSYTTIWEGAVTDTTDIDHKRVITALKQIQSGTNLEEYLDVEAVLKYMAVHTFAVNLDSLTGNMPHNYYLYESDSKLNILPWDYNLSFGGMAIGKDSSASETVNYPVDTPFSSTQFFDALLKDETYLAKYHGYLQQLTEEYVQNKRFDTVYTKIRTQIDDLVKTDPTAFFTYDQYDAGAKMLFQTILLRAESIRGQLAGTIPSTSEEQRENPNALVDAFEIDLSVMGDFQTGGRDFKDQNMQPESDMPFDRKGDMFPGGKNTEVPATKNFISYGISGIILILAFFPVCFYHRKRRYAKSS